MWMKVLKHSNALIVMEVDKYMHQICSVSSKNSSHLKLMSFTHSSSHPLLALSSIIWMYSDIVKNTNDYWKVYMGLISVLLFSTVT